MLVHKIADLEKFNKLLEEAKGGREWKEIAERCQLTPQSIQNYRKGRRKITSNSLMKLALMIVDIDGPDSYTPFYNKLYCCTETYKNMQHDIQCIKKKEKHKDLKEDEIRLENERYRKNGFKGSSIRNMYAAVCIQACVDYRKAMSGCKTVAGRPANEVAKECHNFFGSPIFRTESGQKSVSYIEKCIMRTKPGDLQWIWRQNELYRKPVSFSECERFRDPKSGRFAKNTTNIIEGR